jgi:hypothetical protein
MSEQIAIFQLKTVLILHFVKYINIHIYNKLIIKFNEKFIKTQTTSLCILFVLQTEYH